MNKYDAQGNLIDAQTIEKIVRVLAFSTTTPLAANAVYTSPTVDGINHKLLVGLITSDQAGTYFTQYSDDGVTWYNNTATSTALAASGVGTVATNLLLRYVRIQYTNGATLQGTFKLSMYLSPL